MTFNVFTGISALQTAVSTRLSAWSDTAASRVLDQVQNLPYWNNIGMDRPASLTDLAHPRTAVHLFINPHLAHSICRLIGMDARSVIGREVRSNRLLSNLSVPAVALRLTDHLHSVPASRVVLLLQKHPNVRLFLAREGRAEARVPASLISILLMAVKKGENVVFRAEGEGGAEVLRQIQTYNAMEWFNGDRKRGKVPTRDILGTGFAGIVSQIQDAMEEFEERELAAIYHPESRRLVVSHILSTHKEIAKTSGFADPESYHRLNVSLDEGFLQACFAPGEDRQKKAGRDYLEYWLRSLFRGVPMDDFGRVFAKRLLVP
ncbi:MAG TPA: HPr family phosphocarrier protein [bacterium]|nr:HPr family phosphocarrier protein [bacterium]